MIQLGDITKIRGSDVPIVNVIIGGSPCQDLSIAGKRAGLAGERSGLFMEQLRIIKEMRKLDESRNRTGKDIRPRFMVWENVPGAFSSTKGTTSEQSSKKRSASSAKKPPLFLNLKKDGQQPDALLEWVTGGDSQSLGVYSMHSFGESPNVAVESHLSQILEEAPHQKYYLSEKACRGILRRAERRGKSLPPMLKAALNEMIQYWQAMGGDNHIPSKSDQGVKVEEKEL